MPEEIDFTKSEFPEREIKLPLTKEIKDELDLKLLALPESKKGLFRDSVIFVESIPPTENKEDSDWIKKWKAKDLSYGEKELKVNKKTFYIFEKEGQAKQFIKEQPLFYDRAGLWWIWNKKEKRWEIHDKTDILNSIRNEIGINTINAKERFEIINALQQVGRENIPKELPKECIQFKGKIFNIKTGEEFESTPEYFSTNPIPWEIGESEETPTMDKYFEEWVGKEHVKTLYEIIAYTSCSEQFLQRIIALVGGGSNGKGTLMKLLKKFLGKENYSTSELSLLALNQFETSTIYKKLLCEIGEVSHNDLKSTNQLKKLAGEDDVRYCFKGKTPFTDASPTTCIICTNSLPDTKDKTVGFYRRWLIIDFPNQFPITRGLIEKIPNREFENLAKKSIGILKKLYKKEKFINEGSFQERAEMYENRSNPVIGFIENYCDEDSGYYVSLKKFSKKLNEYFKLKQLRVMTIKETKKKLIEEGFEVRRGTKNYVTDIYIFNLRIKNIHFIPNIPKNETHLLRKKQISKNGIKGINGIKLEENGEKINEKQNKH